MLQIRCLAREIIMKKIAIVLTLQDVFYLITIFEADMNSHIEYIDALKKFEYNKNFMKDYIRMQDNFFDTLASGGISRDEIIEGFQSYALSVENSKSEKVTNCDLKWLLDDKKKYIFNRQIELSKSMNANIRKAYAREAEIHTNS